MSIVSAPAPIQSLVPSTGWLASLRCAHPSNGDFTPHPATPRWPVPSPHSLGCKTAKLELSQSLSLCNSHPLLPGLSCGARQSPSTPSPQATQQISKCNYYTRRSSRRHALCWLNMATGPHLCVLSPRSYFQNYT